MGKYIKSITYSVRKEELEKFTKAMKDIKILHIYEFIEELFSKNKIEGNGVSKVIINYTFEQKENHRIEDLIDVLVIDSYLDIEKLNFKEKIEIYKYILDNIYDNLKFISYYKHIEISKFEEIYKEIIDKNFVYSGVILKNKKSPNKSHTASILFYFENEISIWLDIDNGIKRKNFPIRKSYLATYKTSFDKLEWVDDNLIKIWNKNKKDYWSYNLSEDKLEFYFERAEKGDAHGEYDLGMMYLEGRGVFADKEKAIYWLKKSALQNYVKAKKMLEKI